MRVDAWMDLVAFPQWSLAKVAGSWLAEEGASLKAGETVGDCGKVGI